MKTLRLKVNMTCATCAGRIDAKLNSMGVKSQSNPALKIVKIEYDDSKYFEDQIIKEINKLGYTSEKR